MINTKKILFIYFLAGIISMPCVFADEKTESDHSIKTLEKNFYYKNIEHRDFYPSKNSSIKPVVKRIKKDNKVPKIYNIDLNSKSSLNESKPKVVTFNNNLSKAKQAINEGDFKTGLIYLNKISDQSPTWVLAEQAGLYERIDQLHLALKTYEKAINRGENITELLYNQAACYYKSNNLNKAQATFEKVLNLSPDFMLAYYKLGNIHFRQNEYYKALRYYQRSLELNPLSLDSLYNMGVTLEVINEPKLALKYYQKYDHIEPKDMQVQKSIKRLQLNLSKTTG